MYMTCPSPMSHRSSANITPLYPRLTVNRSVQYTEMYILYYHNISPLQKKKYILINYGLRNVEMKTLLSMLRVACHHLSGK